MRYIVKPSKFRKTPLLLKEMTNAVKLVSYPGRFQPALDWTQDLFLAYPKIDRYPNQIENVPASYHNIADFYGSSKRDQRSSIRASGLKTPEDYASTHFIVRPLHHFGGHDYRITEDANDYDSATQYISPAFPKKREYRVLFINGSPLILLRKKPGEGSTPFSAWNHTNGAFFQTVRDIPGSLLSATSFFSDAASFCVLRDTRLVAADVLLGDNNTYAVTEVNFAPALSIETNLEVIRNAFSSR